MNYLLVVYRNPAPGQPDEQFEQACHVYDDWLRGRDHLVTVITLPADQTITLHRHQGQLELHDGRYSASSDAPIRVYLIKARDLNNAIHIAAQMPQGTQGAIEVQPIVMLAA